MRPNKRGVKVTAYDGATTVKLDAQITPSTQGLVFLDDFHGAGGLTASGQQFRQKELLYMEDGQRFKELQRV